MTILLALALQAASPAASDCQALVGSILDGPDIAALPNQVDGTTLRTPADLRRLRAERGAAPLIINGGNLSGADLRGGPLRNLCFSGTDLSGTDWRGVDAAGSAFIDTKLTGANLSGARLARVLFRQADLQNAQALDADLSGGKMDGGWDGSVENFRADRANLTNFRFDCGITVADGCPLQGDMRLTGANLTGASLHSYFRFSGWDGARIDGTELSLQQLTEVDRADLRGPLRVRGGDTVVTLSPAEYRTLRPYITSAFGSPPPSFDCAAARSVVERTICGEGGFNLRPLDAEIATLYQRARAAGPQVAAEQQAWLRERNRCGADVDCIQASYERRKGQLVGRLGPPAWARTGAAALFVAPEIVVAPAFQDHPLYRRLLPVLIDGASARVVVRVNANGSIDAGGDAVGGNAHLCSLGGEGLRFDAANGWYSGAYEGDAAAVPAALRGRPMPVLRFVEDGAEVYRNGLGGYDSSADPRPSDYASCGARAMFPDLVRVPVTAAEADDLLRSYAERD